MLERKRFISVFLVILSLLLGAYILFFSDNSSRFSKLLISEQEYEDIVKVRSKTSEDMLKTLIFDEENLFFDADADTFYYSLPEGSADAYDPCIEWKSSREISLVVLGHGITKDDIKNNYTFKILI